MEALDSISSHIPEENTQEHDLEDFILLDSEEFSTVIHSQWMQLI